LLFIAVLFLLKITPEQVTDDIMRFASPKQTLRDKALIAKRKKRSRRITITLNRMRDALESTGKGKQFTIACASSLLLMIAGCAAAVLIGNLFLIPVLALAFALIPFYFAMKTINFYDNHIKEELETALSIITTSYIRSEDIVTAVRENAKYLKPPVKDIFVDFVTESVNISSDIKKSIGNLRDRIDNTIFHEWCDTLIACQDDRSLKDTLMAVVTKLTDVRIVNNELKTMIAEVRREYYMMVAMLVGNIPLLYFLNRDWFNALMFTTPGKLVLALCGVVIIVTAIFNARFTKPIEYRR